MTRVALAVLLLGIAVPALLANGGTVRIASEPAGRYFVSVFSSPTPLRTGEVDISVLVQDSSEAVVETVPVVVEATPRAVEVGEGEREPAPIRHGATREQATNKLFKAAKFEIGTPGEWEFRIHVGEEEGGAVSFRAALTRPSLLDRPYLLALLILLPLALVGWLMSRKEEEPAG